MNMLYGLACGNCLYYVSIFPKFPWDGTYRCVKCENNGILGDEDSSDQSLLELLVYSVNNLAGRFPDALDTSSDNRRANAKRIDKHFKR